MGVQKGALPIADVVDTISPANLDWNLHSEQSKRIMGVIRLGVLWKSSF